MVIRYPDGAVKLESWTTSKPGEIENTEVDVPHRLDGPATIEYAPDGSVIGTQWALFGENVSGPAEIGRGIAFRSDADLRERFAGTKYASLLAEGVGPRRIVEVLAEGVYTPSGIREVLGGTPVEWVAAYEEAGE